MTDYSDWEHIFKSPWCPVTGEIPGISYSGFDFDGAVPDDPLDQLATVIEDSRKLLEIDLIEFADPSPSTLEYINLIRSIFGSSRGIYQYLDYYKYGDGFNHLKFTEKIIASANDYLELEVPGSIILSVLAIKEAYRQAYNLVMYNDESVNSGKAVELLREAEKLAEEEEYENKIQFIKPLAEKELEAQKHRSNGGKINAENYAYKYDELNLISRAKDLKDKRPELRIRSAANILEKETGISFETIRKIKGIKDLFKK